MKRMKLKKNDPVVIVSGKRTDRGKVGKISRIIPDKNKIVVEKVHMIKEFVRANPQKNIQGGIVERESAIPVSHVLYHCKECEQGVRVGYKVTEDSKQRVCKKCGIALD